jgi:transcription elongation factor GreA
MTERATPLPGASELMRALGLLVDGPAQWSRPISSRAPGVFVVELPGGRAEAPIDTVALRRWLEHVPDLRLDGQQPSAHELGRHLARFWLPMEPILFVGRATRALGQRIAAMYATPLGETRPYARAHWLKTLAALPDLRIWWAETDAHEEYQDALLAEVEARNSPAPPSLPADQPILPYANLVSTAGIARQHGLQNALAEPRDDTGSLAARQPAARLRRSDPPRRRTATRPRAGRPANTPGQMRPQPEPTLLSKAGLDRLMSELDDLRSNVRPQVIARVQAARELGDLRENSDYEYARKEQSFVEGRIQMLEAQVKATVVVDAPAQGATAAQVGSTVTVDSDGQELTFILVGSADSDPAAGRISYTSPVGRALLGAHAGDDVDAQLPGKVARYHVREVR